jgi:hypothetical protein
MPHRNRVTPEGEIVAVDARGGMYGNRGGCFHRDDQTLKRRPFASKQWICCVLQFKGRRRKLLQPGLFTELFFLDEATAMAAGHRPCFECRRADAERFAVLWNEVRGKPGRAAAPDISRATLGGLADGTFVRTTGGASLVWGGQLWPWSFAGYGAAQHAPADKLVDVLTPPSIVAILAAGFRPKVHETLNAATANRV